MSLKKSLGQNLLIDQNIIRKIVSLTTFQKKDIIEIGPGTGALTKEILKNNPRKLICIEKDKNFVNSLKKFSNKEKTLSIINADILKINLKKLIFMFQKEVGEKIIAPPGNSNFSRLSIITKSRFRILKSFYVSKNCFVPRPKVDSMVIEFEPILKKNINFKSIKTLEYVTNIFFSNKRKMINKAFKKLGINDKEFFKKQKIDLSLRAEKLNEDQFYSIAGYYEKTK